MKNNTDKITATVYRCNCGDLFADEESLLIHVTNKKKGRHRALHFPGLVDASGKKRDMVANVIQIGVNNRTTN